MTLPWPLKYLALGDQQAPGECIMVGDIHVNWMGTHIGKKSRYTPFDNSGMSVY